MWAEEHIVFCSVADICWRPPLLFVFFSAGGKRKPLCASRWRGTVRLWRELRQTMIRSSPPWEETWTAWRRSCTTSRRTTMRWDSCMKSMTKRRTQQDKTVRLNQNVFFLTTVFHCDVCVARTILHSFNSCQSKCNKQEVGVFEATLLVTWLHQKLEVYLLISPVHCEKTKSDFTSCTDGKAQFYFEMPRFVLQQLLRLIQSECHETVARFSQLHENQFPESL